MFYLFSFGFIVIGIIAMITGCDATIAFIAGKIGGKK